MTICFLSFFRSQTKLLNLIKKDLGTQNHQVKVACLKALGKGTHILSAQDRSLATEIMVIVHRLVTPWTSNTVSFLKWIIISRYSQSQDPRVRKAAFQALFDIHNMGHKLDSGTYKEICMALTDDYEGVRMAGLKLVHAMAEAYPEEQVMDDSGKIWTRSEWQK